MAIFKCKMCGGTLEVQPGTTVAVCEYCGTKQTLPKLNDDRRANLYDRANHFRRNNEFDKAAGIYNQILNEDSADAEAYWSLILCRYGIEYVEDPATHHLVPTVNRTQFTSVFGDADYKSALQYADASQRAVYEDEAKSINEIQKGILAISQKEEPFDVFICYKETDANGRRTPDSVLANDLYHQLTQEGFKVFFSRITLEDKLGTAYEPYIFAALNSAKVMVALGTKPEYFNAVWVKNEWSRYLTLIKNGAHKVLIPAYKDMDPYDLPEEFSHLQAQDMGKLGFMQDLIRGIKKLAQPETAQSAPRQVIASPAEPTAGAAPLLRRAFLFLEDGDWKSADEYCEKVLDLDPECAEAYLGKLMAELQVSQKEKLTDCAEPFDGNSYYQKALRFADANLTGTLKESVVYIKTRNEKARITSIYAEATNKMQQAKHNPRDSVSLYLKAAELFKSISEFRDAKALEKQCEENAEESRKNAVYDAAKYKMSTTSKVQNLTAIEQFQTILGWKDSDAMIDLCQQYIEQIEIREQEKKKKAKKTSTIISVAIVLTFLSILAIAIFTNVIIPGKAYQQAISLMEKGNYLEAYDAFIALGDFKDSVERSKSAGYEASELLIDNKCYKEAYEILISLEDFKDSKEIATCILDLISLKQAKVGRRVIYGKYEQDNNISNGSEPIEWIILAKEDEKILLISRYALDAQPYNTTMMDVTWEKCTLRDWLNNAFFYNAFSEWEQKSIVMETIVTENPPDNSKSVTQDRVFLLSDSEVHLYFDYLSGGLCAPTDYVISKGVYISDETKMCCWRLRTPAWIVTAKGYDVDDFILMDSSRYTVRPVIMIE